MTLGSTAVTLGRWMHQRQTENPPREYHDLNPSLQQVFSVGCQSTDIQRLVSGTHRNGQSCCPRYRSWVGYSHFCFLKQFSVESRAAQFTAPTGCNQSQGAATTANNTSAQAQRHVSGMIKFPTHPFSDIVEYGRQR